MLSTLNRKLLRDAWKLRGQMLSIAAVVAVGIATVLTMRGTYESLVLSRDAYYRSERFPDIWVSLKRAPDFVEQRILALPGVSSVRTRVSFSAALEVPAADTPGLGRFVSIPEPRQSMLADLHLATGRYLDPSQRDEAIISKKFAIANGLTPGDTLRAVINGRRRDLRVVGTAISPEHIYAVPPGALFPDDKRYGIVWMSRKELGPAYDMEGAFNEVVLGFGPGAKPAQLLAELDRILEPYGGLGAHLRADQPSNQLLQGELDGDRTMGTAIPAVFLAVAAFLLNIVLGRMIATQRSEIAVLKAFGYTNFEVGAHYLRYAFVAVAAGTLGGIFVGIGLGHAMTGVYGGVFDFPDLRYVVSPRLIAIAVGVSALSATLGALGAVRRAVRLPPAEAMRPEAPAGFHAGVFERLGISKLLSPTGRMIFRNAERQPWRSLFATTGVAFSVAIMVIGLFLFDGFQLMMNLQFRVAEREDLSLTFNQPLPLTGQYDLAHLRGVTQVEPFRVVPVRLRAGHRSREVAVTGLHSESQLRRVVTSAGAPRSLPPEGLMLSARLASKLGVVAGDRVEVEVLEGERLSAELPVADVIDDFVGVSAYMRLDSLQRLTRGERSFSGAYLAVEESMRAPLNAELKRLPVVAAVASRQQLLKSFQEQLAHSLFIGVFFMLGFSCVISIAVIYNGARIALSERGRELASLRVFGFTKREVAVLLLGEQALVTLLGIPFGCGLGYVLSAAVSAGLQSDAYRIPLVIKTTTFAWAALATIFASLFSGWLVKRRLDHMSLIEVLKTRE